MLPQSSDLSGRRGGGGATPAVSQDRQRRVADVRPDLAERPLADVAEAVAPAKLVGVDVAQRVDVPHRYPRLVGALPAQHLIDVVYPLRLALPHPQVQIDAVRVIV